MIRICLNLNAFFYAWKIGILAAQLGLRQLQITVIEIELTQENADCAAT